MNMSVKNDIIKLNEVIKQGSELLREQSGLWSAILQDVKKINQSAPSSYIKMQKEMSIAIQQAEKAEQQYLKTMQQKQILEQKYLATQKSVIQTSEASRRASEAYARTKEREAKAELKARQEVEKSANAYDKLQQKVRQATQTYNDLAVRKAQGEKLYASELVQLSRLEGELQSYDKILKQVDATIGKNQRNVGNYAGAWSPLSNAVTQFSRELPNAGISFQTFVMSLTNNVGALQDAVTDLRAKNQQLIKDGLPTKSVMGQVIGAFLSWNTALFAGIAIVTAYSKEIGEFFTEMFQGSKKVDSAKIAIASYNEALKDGDYKKAYEDVTRVGLAFEQARKGTISKKEALEVYNNTLGDVMGRTNDFNKAEAIYNSQADKYIQATLAKASANHLFAKSAELNAQKVELLNQKEFSWLEKRKNEFNNLFQNTSQYSAQALSEMENVKKATKIDEEINANKEAIKGFFADYEKASEGLNLGNFLGGDNKKDKKKKDTTEKDRLEALRQQYEHQVSIFNLMEDGVDKEIRLLEASYKYQNELDKGNKIKLLTNTNEYLTKLNKLISDAKKEEEDKKKKADDEFLKEQEELFKEDERITKEYNDDKQAWKDKADAEYLKSEQEKTDEYLRQVDRIKDYISQGMDLGNFGFGSLNIFTQMEENGKSAFENMLENAEGWKEKMAVITQAVGDVLKDVFNQMEERQNAYYERQFANLDKEKEVALQFAGESATGREAIEKQYEEKKIALQREQVKKQKQIAIFSAIINIAQGITASLAQGGPAGIILAALVGVLGAVQIASIANTPLPAFEKGTSNAPQGWAITQEKGAEMITDKHGNIKTLGNNKGNQLTYLNKGDKVYTADETTKRINEMLLGTGVAPIVSTNVSSGLTKDEMLEVMHQTLSKQPKTSVVFDQYGYNLYQEKKNSRTNLKNRNAKI